MRRVLIAAEGQTEERFIKDILAPHLHVRGLAPQPSILRSKIVREGGHFKGGLTRFRQADERVRRLLHDTDAALVTTMFDYCGAWKADFLRNYCGARELESGTAAERVCELE